MITAEEIAWVKENHIVGASDNVERFNEYFNANRSYRSYKYICSKVGFKRTLFKNYPELESIIKENYNKCTLDELVKLIQNKGIQCTYSGVHNLICKLNLQKQPRKNIDTIRLYDTSLTHEELAKELNVPVTYIRGARAYRGIKYTEEQFHKSFPLGNTYEHNGLTYVKYKHERGGSAYKSKAVLIYEQAYGPVPKTHCIIFLDGNKKNYSLDNLYCLDKKYAPKIAQMYGKGIITKAMIKLLETEGILNDTKRDIRYNKK